MGIRHLQTFMEKKVKGGLYTVNMEQEILSAKKLEQNPLIVIDLMALHCLFGYDKRSLLCGSQVSVVEFMADTFFKRLTDAGAELVFFYDDIVHQNKYKTWMQRQNDRYFRMIDIIDGIEAEMTLAGAARKFNRTLPNNTCIKLKDVAKRHGKTITSFDLECDQALAIYATKHKALAVMTQDTDFFIFEGDWQLWQVKYMSTDTPFTKANGRQALLRTLGLQWPQMAIFATLGGNDFFKYDEVEPFLNDLGPHNQKFYKLADYVRRLPLRNKKLDDKTVHSVLGRVYKNRSVPTEAFKWFLQSLAFYQVDESSVDMPRQVDDPFAYLLNSGHQFTHAVLTGAPFNCTLLFFDCRSSEFGNYYEIIEPIIARIGGILLYHHQHERQDVTVATKRSHEEPYSFGTVSVTFPSNIKPPTIMELISKDENVQASLLQRKLQLLRWVCSDDLLNEEEFNIVPPSFMCTVLTLYRLRQCSAIRMFEADLLLLIAHQLSAGVFDPRDEPHPYRLSSRAFRLGFLFHKIYSDMVRVAKALGLPKQYRPSVPYDGHRFHNMHREWLRMKIEPHHIEPIAKWRIYKNIQRP